MEFAAYNARMICDDDITRYKAGDVALGYEFKVTYPTYRGCYLSNIQEFQVWVNGKEIDNKNLRFGINGKWFLIEQIADAHYEYLFTGKKATVRVLDYEPVEGELTIKMHIMHKIPYTGYFGNYLILPGDCEKTLKIAD